MWIFFNSSLVSWHYVSLFPRKALQHMPPLSLTPGSTDFSSFLSPNVLEEVDSFLIRITRWACVVDAVGSGLEESVNQIFPSLLTWSFYFSILKNTSTRNRHLRDSVAACLYWKPKCPRFSSHTAVVLPPSCCTTPEVELTLLAFALARGSVAKVLSSLCAITDHLDTPYKASSLISSMATVRQNLLYKYGNGTILAPSLYRLNKTHSFQLFRLLGFKIIQIFWIKNYHWNYSLAAELPEKLVVVQLSVIKDWNQVGSSQENQHELSRSWPLYQGGDGGVCVA